MENGINSEKRGDGGVAGDGELDPQLAPNPSSDPDFPRLPENPGISRIFPDFPRFSPSLHQIPAAQIPEFPRISPIFPACTKSAPNYIFIKVPPSLLPARISPRAVLPGPPRYFYRGSGRRSELLFGKYIPSPDRNLCRRVAEAGERVLGPAFLKTSFRSA